MYGGPWYLLCADAVVDIHYIRLHYIPRSPTSTSQRLKSIYRHSQLEIPWLQLPPKHPLGILPPTNLQQPFPVRGPVPVKHSLPLARVVLIDEAVVEIAFFGGEVAAGYEAGCEGEDCSVGGGRGPGGGDVEDCGFFGAG